MSLTCYLKTVHIVKISIFVHYTISVQMSICFIMTHTTIMWCVILCIHVTHYSLLWVWCKNIFMIASLWTMLVTLSVWLWEYVRACVHKEGISDWLLRNILWPKREEVIGGLKQLHDEELHTLHSLNIIRVIRWLKAYTNFGREWRNEYMTDWKFGGKRLLTRPSHKWQDQ